MPHLHDIIYLLPEIILLLGALSLLMIGAFMRGEKIAPLAGGGGVKTTMKDEATIAVAANRKNWLLAGGAMLVIALALMASLPQTVPDGNEILSGMLRIDRFGHAVKIFILIGTGFSLLVGWRWLMRAKAAMFELPVLMLFAVIGMTQMVAANNLIVLFLGLELQNLALYVLASSQRESRRSSEAGLKYFVLGALSSGLLLYGMSLLYGFTGALNYDAIANNIATQNGGVMPYGILIGMIFIITGIGFKISAVPFHMWTPDVYEGAPTPITNFFAVVPKLAGFAVIMRLLVEVFGEFHVEAGQILVVLSMASMVVGSLAAINQRSIKRLMAYSAISHVGYGLIGLAGNNADAYAATLVYLGIYVPMTLGTFGCILAMTRGGKPLDELSDLAGLAKYHPWLAAALAVFMFSMAGIPPLAGFFAKFYIFRSAIDNNLIALAVVGVLSSVVSAYYYCRIIKLIYFDPPQAKGALDPLPREVAWVIGLTAMVILWFVLWPNGYIDWVRHAATDLWKGSE
ncbi:MAG: NADH-quinone oxidoreductase subunit NuoN [Candidatus Symbiobacter sp.]|nr:NADH-quinone oxidoreductase subunit NuoN [Candidatus Symbiobacter sp.]